MFHFERGSLFKFINVLIVVAPFAKQITIFWGYGKVDRQVDYKFSIEFLHPNSKYPWSNS